MKKKGWLLGESSGGLAKRVGSLGVQKRDKGWPFQSWREGFFFLATGWREGDIEEKTN